MYNKHYYHTYINRYINCTRVLVNSRCRYRRKLYVYRISIILFEHLWAKRWIWSKKQYNRKEKNPKKEGGEQGEGTELSRHNRYNIIYIISHSPKTSLQPRARVVCEKSKNRPLNVREKRINDLQCTEYTGGTQHGARIQPMYTNMCVLILYTMVVQNCQTFSPVTPPDNPNLYVHLICIYV